MSLKKRKLHKFQVVIICFILSALLHTGGYFSLPTEKLIVSEKITNPIEVEYHSWEKSKKTIVRDPLHGKITKQRKKVSDLLSKYNRSVLKESQLINKSRKVKQTQPKRISKKPLYSDSSSAVSTLRQTPYVKKSFSNLDYLPNVAEGRMQALNTNQFKYYTYFDRISEQISYRWKNELRKSSQKLKRRDLNKLRFKEHHTRVEVVLNKYGQYIDSTIHHSSKIPVLDQAVIKAFLAASPFLNPPKGLISKDGTVRLNYSFYLLN